MDAAVLRVLVQAVGITKTNAELASLQGGLTGAAAAAKQYTAAQAAAGRSAQTAAARTAKQAQVSAAATSALRSQTKAAGALAVAQGASSSAAAKQTSATTALTAAQKRQQAATQATAATTATHAGATQAATIATAGLAYGLYKAVSAGTQFEKKMDALGAVTRANERDMGRLEKQALRLGAATQFSAGEAADAQIELAKGGLAVKQILGGALPAALALAAAGEMELGEAAETTVNVMKLFGLEGRAAIQVADMLATAANTTTADVTDFALAMKMGGSVAKLAGLSLNEAVTVLEALAEAGIKGSDAGTSMKAFFLNLTRDVPKAKKAMKELGVEIFDAQGNIKPLPAVAANLRQAFGSLTRQQFLTKAGVIAGSDAVRTLWALYDAGPRKLKRLMKANAENGTAQEVARRKTDNLAGDTEQLGGAFETLAITAGIALVPALRFVAQHLTELVDATTVALPYLAPLAAGIAALAVSILVAKGIGALEAALTFLGANPIFLVIAGLVALGVALVVAYKKSEDFRRVVDAVWGAVKSATASAVAWIVGTAVPAIVGAWEWLAANTVGVRAAVAAVAAEFVGRGRTIVGAVVSVVKFLTPVWRLLGTTLVAIAKEMWASIVQVVRGALTLFKGVIKLIDAVFRGDFRGMWQALKQIFRGGVDFIIGMLRGATAPLRTVVTRIGGAMLTAAKDGWDKLKSSASSFAGGFKDIIVGAFEGAANKVIGFINTIIGAINLIPGVDIGLVGKLGGGGSKRPMTMVDPIAKAGASQALAVGGKITRPLAIVGEEAPRHPEYVIPTNPAYRSRAVGLYQRLGAELGMRVGDGQVPGYAIGGVIGDAAKGALKSLAPAPIRGALDAVSGLDAGSIIGKLPGVGGLPGWLHGMGDFALDKAKTYIKDKVAELLPSLSGGGGDVNGLLPQVLRAIAFARANGWGGTILSGFRSRAEQAELYRRYRAGTGNLAAPPGSSNHEGGVAIDVSDPEGFARAMDKMGAGRLYRRVPGEPWHFSITGYAKGGVMAAAAAARKRMRGIGVGALDKQFPEHGLYDTAGKKFIGFDAWRRIFETQGATPLEALRFAWISRGEGGGGLMGAYPGIRGDDPGGTKGRGGVQLTPGTWSPASATYKLMQRLGGEMALYNPHNQAKVALSLLREGGWENWVRTRYWHQAMAIQSAESVLTKGDKAWMAGATAPTIGKVGAPKAPKGKGLIPTTLRRVAKANGRKSRGAAVKQAIKAIRSIGMGGAASKLDGLNGKVAKYADWATRAEQLTIPEGYDANGNVTPAIPGIVEGHDQAHWLTEQLKALKDQRNTLIRAHEQIEAARDRATRIIENARKQLAPVLKQRQKAVAVLNEAKKIKGDKRRAAAVKAAERQLAPWTQRRDALQSIIEAAGDRRKTLNTKRGDVLADLDRVQGPVSGDLRLKRMSSLPAPGVLGGEIFGVQMHLRDLGAKTSAPGVDKDELLRIKDEQLRIANQRTAVANSQFAVLRNLGPLPGFAGMYAQGGSIPAGMWGIAGETGRPEIVHGPATVYSPAQTQSMLAPAGEREIRVVVEDNRIVVHDDGRVIEEIVDDRVNQLARRGTTKTPGGSRP